MIPPQQQENMQFGTIQSALTQIKQLKSTIKTTIMLVSYPFYKEEMKTVNLRN